MENPSGLIAGHDALTTPKIIHCSMLVKKLRIKKPTQSMTKDCPIKNLLESETIHCAITKTLAFRPKGNPPIRSARMPAAKAIHGGNSVGR